MVEQGLVLIAVVLYASSLLLAAQRWRFEHSADPSLQSPLGRFVIILATVTGLAGAPLWWLGIEPVLPWDLPQLAAHLLGVAGIAFGITGLAVLERPDTRRTRLYLVMIAAFIVPLLAVSVLYHLARFDFGRPITWCFFGIGTVLALASVAELLRVLAAHPGLPANRFETPIPPLWLMLVGLGMSAWALALLIAPDTLFPAVFVWPEDGLSSRLMASMLLSLGIASLLSTDDEASGRLALLFGGVFGAGVILALGLGAASGASVPLLYALGLGGTGLVSLALLAMLMTGPRHPALLHRTRTTM